jgi:hypothetical protein
MGYGLVLMYKMSNFPQGKGIGLASISEIPIRPITNANAYKRLPLAATLWTQGTFRSWHLLEG